MTRFRQLLTQPIDIEQITTQSTLVSDSILFSLLCVESCYALPVSGEFCYEAINLRDISSHLGLKYLPFLLEMPLDPFCPALTRSVLLVYLCAGTLFVVVIFKILEASAVVNLSSSTGMRR